MTPADYSRIKKLFAEAIQLPEPEREAFVHAQCGEDSKTEQEVLSLLRHHQDETLLETAKEHANHFGQQEVLDYLSEMTG